MLLNALILAGVIACALLVFSPRFQRSTRWRATITPLASIIGSGFLILGPLLDLSFGLYAPLVMAGLCGLAWLFGRAIRFNIARIDDDTGRSSTETRLETAASWALAFAYVISVAYYLNLFGAFAVSLTPFDQPIYARGVTTAIFVFIAVIGWTRGFHALENLEYLSVGAKLAIIAGLLIGLGIYFGERAAASELVFLPPSVTGWPAVTLAFGLIVTVQGFETSRYLGEQYDATTRINTMRNAQILSAVIYMIYIVLIAYVFPESELAIKETAIVDMMRVVAPILPALLVVAALAAQFSAAVADTGGSGGLFNELTTDRFSQRHGYVLLVVIGVALTWTADVFEIVSYASRAFAAYYGVQAAIAFTAARRLKRPGYEAAGFAALALLGAAIVIFGQAVEG